MIVLTIKVLRGDGLVMKKIHLAKWIENFVSITLLG